MGDISSSGDEEDSVRIGVKSTLGSSFPEAFSSLNMQKYAEGRTHKGWGESGCHKVGTYDCMLLKDVFLWPDLLLNIFTNVFKNHNM